MYVIKLLKVMPIESGALCSFGLGCANDHEFGAFCEGLINPLRSKWGRRQEIEKKRYKRKYRTSAQSEALDRKI